LSTNIILKLIYPQRPWQEAHERKSPRFPVHRSIGDEFSFKPPPAAETNHRSTLLCDIVEELLVLDKILKAMLSIGCANAEIFP